MREEMILRSNWKFTDSPLESGQLFSCLEEGMETVSVPHDWAISRPFNPDMEFGCPQGFFDRAGTGWYRKHLVLEEVKTDCKYILTFDGVYENTSIWVNEKFAGAHRYGYSGFQLDITEMVREGDNLVAVRVDNSNSWPDRWYSGAGIYRRVKLEILPDCHIVAEETRVSAWLDGENGVVEVEVPVFSGKHGVTEEAQTAPAVPEAPTVQTVPAIEPPSFDSPQTLNIRVEIEQNGELPLAAAATAAPAASGKTLLKLTVPSAKLWDDENPQLYTVTVCLSDSEGELDRITRRIGFRTVTWNSGQGLMVNGKNIKLKGVCLHHDGGCLGAAVTAGTWKQRLTLLKNMGCNAIRTSHNIPDEIFLDLCDEMGFYVLDEFVDKWKDGSYGRYFEEDWKSDLDYMVMRDRHRSSVIMWSVGNEVDRQGSPFMLDILYMLVQEVKRLDETRPVTCALSPHYSDDDRKEWLELEERLDAIVRISEEVDILSLNYQEQWYALLHERIPEKLILGTEIYMFFKGHEKQYMNYSMDTPWMDVERNGYVVGGFVWAGIDYLGESMAYPAKGWGGSLIRTNLVKKPVAYLWESYWSRKPMVYFAVQDYTLQDDLSREHWSCPRLAPHWNFEQYGRTVIPYMIFTNCDEVEVYLNDVRYYVRKPEECEGRIITGFLPYVPGTVRVVGVKNGKSECEYTVKTAGAAAELTVEVETYGREEMSQIEDSVIYTMVSAVDKAGTVCFKENVLVHVSVEGPAVLAGVDNGDLLDTNPYQADTVRLSWGKAAVVLKPNGEAGRVVLTVWADGFAVVRTEVAVI